MAVTLSRSRHPRERARVLKADSLPAVPPLPQAANGVAADLEHARDALCRACATVLRDALGEPPLNSGLLVRREFAAPGREGEGLLAAKAAAACRAGAVVTELDDVFAVATAGAG